MIRVSIAAAGVLLIASLAAAQPPSLPAQQPTGTMTGQVQGRGAQPQAPPQNLQVLPKDMPREQLLATMQQFTQSLGVQCNYCHVQEGRGGRNDFATDEKQTKKTARQMMIFSRDLNEKLPSVVGKPANETTRVGCSTCHRGVPIPRQLTDL